MIQPLLQDDAFLADVRQTWALDRDRPRGDFHLWWLGQSGFLLAWQGHHLMLDPYLSDSLTRKYAGTEKPHVRMTERVIAPERLDFIGVTTSSHHHTDHLDAETLIPLMKANPEMALVIPEANRALAAERLGVAPAWPIGLDDGQTLDLAGFRFTAVASAHENVDRDASGRCKYLGYVVQFGTWTIYHSGDTVLYDGMVEKLRRWSIDVALLPINGRDARRGVAGNLDAAEAVALAKAVGVRLIIPCHYEMFQFNTVSPETVATEATKAGQPCQVLKCGERWSSSRLQRPTER
ncbi:MAG: MBL fold metallo-hydrolase [Acidobacteriota bacterium]